MSGVNWLPPWTLDRDTTHGALSHDCRRRRGRSLDRRLLRRSRSCCARKCFFARRVGERVREHPALFAWDLGNEFSNLREPARRKTPPSGAQRLTDTLLEASGGRVTGGMHGEDLERDRNIRPSSIALPWAFATMHGYSVYSAFARDRLDTNVVPFLCQLQQSFSGKARAL